MSRSNTSTLAGFASLLGGKNQSSVCPSHNETKTMMGINHSSWSWWVLVGLALATTALGYETCNIVKGEEDCNLSTRTGVTAIYPGGTTGCYYRNDTFPNPYFFQVQPGKGTEANNLHIHFQAGGACFDGPSCDPETELAQLTPYVMTDGIFSTHHPRNPFRHWTQVGILYCSGDVHIGQGMSPDGLVEFHGRENTLAALHWTYQNLPNPKRVMVTGSSAGSFGLQYWANPILQHYKSFKSVPILSIGGSEGWLGMRTAPTFPQANWNYCSQEDYGWTPQQYEKCASGIWDTAHAATIAHHNHPDVPFGMISWKDDPIQRYYYCPDESCTQAEQYGQMKKLMRNYTRTENKYANNNVLTYFINGEGHYSIPESLWYSVKSGRGKPFLVQWMAQLANRKSCSRNVYHSSCSRRILTSHLPGVDMGCDSTLSRATFGNRSRHSH